MKIIAISDLHGQLPAIHGMFDTLCICGDIVPLTIQKNITECINWIKQKFIPWCTSIDCSNILLVGGNHDYIFDLWDKEDINNYLFKNTKIHYLEDDSIIIDSISFYGTPACKQFGNWAFMHSDRELKTIYTGIPDNIDVLLTHDAPYGVSDICEQDLPWVSKDHIGNKELREVIINKKPKYNLHGHLHSSNHNMELLENTKVYNVSLLNEQYRIAYKPLELEL